MQRAQEVTNATKELSESQPAEDSAEDGGNKFTVSGRSIHATKCRRYTAAIAVYQNPSTTAKMFSHLLQVV